MLKPASALLLAGVFALLVSAGGPVSYARGQNPSHVAAASPGLPKRELVFASDRADDLRNDDLYVISSDLRVLRNLTRTPAEWECGGSWSPDGRTIGYVRPRAFWTIGVDGRSPTRVFDIDLSRARPGWTPDGDIAWVTSDGIYRAEADGSNRRLVVRSDSAVSVNTSAAPVWSPDASAVAFVGSEPGGGLGIYVAAADGTSVRRLPSAQNPGSPDWSPDGRRLVYAVRGALRIVEADGSRDVKLADTLTAESPSWSPRGDLILFRLDGQIAVIRTDGSSPRRLGTGAFAQWSRDGSRIAFARSGEIQILRADGSRVVTLPRDPRTRRSFCSLDWAPDGGSLVGSTRIAANDQELYRAREDGSGIRALTVNRVADRAPAVSPDGEWIAFERWAERVPYIWLMRADGTGPRARIRGRAPAWSPDGARIIFYRGGRLWAAPTHRGGARLLRRYGSQPAWSPDGRRLVFVARSGRDARAEIVVRDLRFGRERSLTHGRFQAPESPTWSPDGLRIVLTWGWHAELYVMRRDGRGARQLLLRNGTSEFGDEQTGPAWSADGRRIAFAHHVDYDLGNPIYIGDIHVVTTAGNVLSRRADGTPKPLEENLAHDQGPDWVPQCLPAGGPKPDTLPGSPRPQRICGRAGADRISGGGGLDRLFGGDGNDRIDARDNAFDVVGCGRGADRVRADRVDLVGVDCEQVSR